MIINAIVAFIMSFILFRLASMWWTIPIGVLAWIIVKVIKSIHDTFK